MQMRPSLRLLRYDRWLQQALQGLQRQGERAGARGQEAAEAGKELWVADSQEVLPNWGGSNPALLGPMNQLDEPFPLMQAPVCYRVHSFSRVGAFVGVHPVLILWQ